MDAFERHADWAGRHAEFGSALRQRLAVGEGTPGDDDPRPVDERLVQCAWNDQLLRAGELVTASGKRVDVMSPGRWNTGRGPDFLGARFRLAGTEIGGDVELHLRSRDWVGHGHHQDPAYNNVQLHVVLHASDDRPYEEKQDGTRLERLVIGGVLEPSLETLQRTLNVDDYPYGKPADLGLCAADFRGMETGAARAFFVSAGRARLEDKIARFRLQGGSASPRQLLYQALMTGMGYQSNKTLYFLLSKRAPADELVEFAADLAPDAREEMFLAALLFIPQLFPVQGDFFDGADAETLAFAKRMEDCWRGLRPYFRDRLMPPTKRWYSGMRPPGFPARRLAAAARLLTRVADPGAPLFDTFCEQLRAFDFDGATARDWGRWLKERTGEWSVGPHGYFADRFTIGGKRARPQALLGEPAAKTTVFNVLLPLAVVRARGAKDNRLEEQAWRALERFPALPANTVTKLMSRRLFAGEGPDKALFRTELAQQGLYKVFQDCCAHNERTCAHCTFLNPPHRPLSAVEMDGGE